MPINNVERHTHNGIDSEQVNFDDLTNTDTLKIFQQAIPQAEIIAPSGGATIDSEARTAINAIITALETVGILEEN